jgi:hypothetical protein
MNRFGNASENFFIICVFEVTSLNEIIPETTVIIGGLSFGGNSWWLEWAKGRN